jgi:predicted enzyme related to lactoylglutathione lyase
MGQPVVHFEIIGRDPGRLREFYGALFGWEFDVGDAASSAVSEPGKYGFVNGESNGGGEGPNGGVGGGESHEPSVLFYVAVPDVEAALEEAERLGGARVLGPERAPDRGLAVGRLSDPEGNVVGVAGPA